MPASALPRTEMPYSELQRSLAGRGENRSTMMEITENYSLVFPRDLLHDDRKASKRVLSRYDKTIPFSDVNEMVFCSSCYDESYGKCHLRKFLKF